MVLAVSAACAANGASDTTESADPGETTSGVESTTTAPEPGSKPPLELAGTSWTVTHYQSAGAITNLWPDTVITLQFGTNGTISGNAGCNDYTAAYQVSGPYVTEPDPLGDEEQGQGMEISDLTFTEKACESANVMEQETEYLELLPRVEYWSLGEGFGGENSLLLRSVDDGLLIEASPAG